MGPNRDFCGDFPNIDTERYFALFSIFNRDRRSGSPSLIHSLPVHLKSSDFTHIQRVRHTGSHIGCTYLYVYWGATAAPVISVYHMTPTCRMVEVYRKGTQGSVLAWRAASLLLGRLLLLY